MTITNPDPHGKLLRDAVKHLIDIKDPNLLQDLHFARRSYLQRFFNGIGNLPNQETINNWRNLFSTDSRYQYRWAQYGRMFEEGVEAAGLTPDFSRVVETPASELQVPKSGLIAPATSFVDADYRYVEGSGILLREPYRPKDENGVPLGFECDVIVSRLDLRYIPGVKDPNDYSDFYTCKESLGKIANIKNHDGHDGGDFPNESALNAGLRDGSATDKWVMPPGVLVHGRTYNANGKNVGINAKGELVEIDEKGQVVTTDRRGKIIEINEKEDRVKIRTETMLNLQNVGDFADTFATKTNLLQPEHNCVYPDIYWTSTRFGQRYVWAARFGKGLVDYYNQEGFEASVRPVRFGKARELAPRPN